MKLGMAIVITVASLGVACSGTREDVVDPETLDKASQPIIGGTLDQGDPAVGYMSARDGNTGWGCTGTLISPTVFLTAAHCVEDRRASTTFRVTFTHDQSKAQASEWHEVKEAHHDALFMAPGKYINDGHDCAVLILKSPVTTVTPIPINRQPVDSTWHGQPIRLVGYGNNNGRAGTGSGIKREVTVPLEGHRDGVLEIDTAGKTTCQGDSGGPGFMMRNGVETLVSITSYGEQYCPGSAGLSNVQLCLPFVDKYLGTSCTPSCSGKACGSDGCGGSCGSCTAGETCNAQGQCEVSTCTPSCSGKACGADGCGGSCGTCGAGENCNGQGQCEPTPAGCRVGADESEPNDTSTSADALGSGICGALASGDSVDWSTWTAGSAGVPYVVKLETTGDANVAMWKRVNGQWSSIATTGTNTISRTSNGPGQYVVAVWSPSRSAQSYSLTLAH